MKIKLNKGLKIALLKAIQVGELDTNKVPELVSQIANIEPFLELMKEASQHDIKQYEESEIENEVLKHCFIDEIEEYKLNKKV